MNKRIEDLKKRIEDLKRRLPAHSIPPAMMAELDDLEEQLVEKLKKPGTKGETSGKSPSS